MVNNITLVGGVVASINQAVSNGNNRFTTGGELSITDVQNTASFRGSAVDISAGFNGGKPSGSAGMGSASGNAASTTTAGISEVAGNTAVRIRDAETGLKLIFNANQVQGEINAQVTITQAFS